MDVKLFKCPACNRYTLKETCVCGTKTILARPPRFSLDDKYGKYRRMFLRDTYEGNTDSGTKKD